MLKYFLEMDAIERVIGLIFIVVTAAAIFALVWLISISCMVFGYGPEVCGA